MSKFGSGAALCRRMAVNGVGLGPHSDAGGGAAEQVDEARGHAAALEAQYFCLPFVARLERMVQRSQGLLVLSLP